MALSKRPTKSERIAAEKHRSLNVGRKPTKESEDLELLRLIRQVGALYGINTKLPLPDSHPMFDGGRRLLRERARASAGPRRVPSLKLVPKAPDGLEA